MDITPSFKENTHTQQRTLGDLTSKPFFFFFSYFSLSCIFQNFLPMESSKLDFLTPGMDAARRGGPQWPASQHGQRGQVWPALKACMATHARACHQDQYMTNTFLQEMLRASILLGSNLRSQPSAPTLPESREEVTENSPQPAPSTHSVSRHYTPFVPRCSPGAPSTPGQGRAPRGFARRLLLPCRKHRLPVSSDQDLSPRSLPCQSKCCEVHLGPGQGPGGCSATGDKNCSSQECMVYIKLKKKIYSS